MLEKPEELSDLSYAIFLNVAPVEPERALSALERSLFGPKEANR